MLVKSFHRGILAAALSLPIISFSIQSALAESISFTLINRTSRNLLEFYAGYPSEREWADDILGRDVLAPGESATITIGNAHEDCRYDFLGVLGPSDDGSVGRGELIQTNVEVCDGGTYEYTD
ncbi:hypothetical protein [Microcoleus vaginatus]|uniref:hypothetical protein n=1 Tax=Microcoleus TaxID=44471 RepID=UPI001F6241CC|nr:hypothetical protein D0A37_25965 [Microcoleus vaginatus HSN003]